MPPSPHKQDTLSGVAKIAVVVLVVCLGLWGCARKPATPTGAAERIRVLETRCQKLEQDYRSVAQARDKSRKELSAVEEENGRLAQEFARERDLLRGQLKAAQNDLAQRNAERDELKQQLALRTTERDQLQGRVERFRKGFQTLLTQDDAPAGSTIATPVSSTLGSE
jgi:predicted RNase H-like nuclease (RuvC/YqgF family)